MIVYFATGHTSKRPLPRQLESSCSSPSRLIYTVDSPLRFKLVSTFQGHRKNGVLLPYLR